MLLTPFEREILARVRADPLLDTDALAADVGHPRADVEAAIETLTARGTIRGPGWVVGPDQPVVVVGGAVMDCKARCHGPLRLRTSNPGEHEWTPGGVARNIAENLALLGASVELVAPVGADELGRDLIARTGAAGVGVDHVVRSHEATGIYVAVLDDDGDLLVGISDMTATDTLAVHALTGARDTIGSAEILVVDGNVPEPVCAWLLQYAAAAQVPVVIDPVSVTKASHLSRTLSAATPVLLLTPTVDELAAILRRDVADETQAIEVAAAELHERGVRNVWVRRGPAGSMLSSAPETSAASARCWTMTAPEARVVDVTGAGDAMTAGFVHAYLDHRDVRRAVAFGQVAAALTVEVDSTVRQDLGVELVRERAEALGIPL